MSTKSPATTSIVLQLLLLIAAAASVSAAAAAAAVPSALAASKATTTTTKATTAFEDEGEGSYSNGGDSSSSKVRGIEADMSYQLHLGRLQQQQEHQLEVEVEVDEDFDEVDDPRQRSRRLSRHGHSNSKEKKEEKKKKREEEEEKEVVIPEVKHDTDHGMMIDAGSTGTRIHVYEFEARVLSRRVQVERAVAGRRLTFPTTDTRWTDRLKPGLDAFGYVDDFDDMRRQVQNYLQPLLDFAKLVTETKRDRWHRFPIYLKATGGLRTLPRPYRLRLVEAVRACFFDEAFNPFMFEEEHARVISGEEEAIYGWTAVNFVKGTLLTNSEGTGSVLKPALTYGVLEMGGASTQIGFFEPHGDVMANLFKMQIGASKHWNVYCHSFLYFGVNGAYARLNARLCTEHQLQRDVDGAGVNIADADNGGGETAPTAPTDSVYSPCLPGGASYQFTSRVHLNPNNTLLPLSSPGNASILEADLYTTKMRNPNKRGDPDACQALVIKLLRREANAWCLFSHDRDCSFAGVYQPPLPIGSEYFGEFIATSNFYDVWSFLGLPSRGTSLAEVRRGSRRVCNMSLEELTAYNDALPSSPVKSASELTQFCFRSMFVAAFLIEGAGFPESYRNVTTTDVINGQKVGWALGSMLYEINTLPWEFEGAEEEHEKHRHHKHKSSALKFLGLDDMLGGDASSFTLGGVFSLGLVLSALAAVVLGGTKLFAGRREAIGSGTGESSMLAASHRRRRSSGGADERELLPGQNRHLGYGSTAAAGS